MKFSRFRVSVVTLALLVLLMTVSGTVAQDDLPPFGLPIDGEPSPSTWFVTQWYGNTVSAARNAEDLYSAGQGIHFGVDFAARCGTPVLAIGDGVVFANNGPFGSPPNNLVIQHDNGYFSLYGHLQQRSLLMQGQRVSRGDVVGQVGDPASSSCDRAPHLHLEVRTNGMREAVNPVPLIDADWRLLTAGASITPGGFAVDLEHPERWQHAHDQPSIRFQGPRLNEYEYPWLVR
jgi:murein DD-endopeptidase MepM/ murein hydrolase activator NlpD